MLKSIIDQGIVPLFTHWVNRTDSPGQNGDPGEWANTSNLIDYVEFVLKIAPLQRTEFEAIESKESYTWPWKRLQELRSELDSITGLVRISLDGYDGDELLVEFTHDRVVVATIWGTSKLRCEELDRDEWTDRLLELITGRERQTYGKVLLLDKHQVEKMKGPVWFSSVTIFRLK